MTASDMAYLQATRPLARRPDDVAATLRAHGPLLVEDATGRAVTVLEPLLQDGRFRRPAAPRVRTETLARGPAVIRVAWGCSAADRWPPPTPFATRPTSPWWRTDEEETGWPTVTFDLLVEPRGDGCQLAAISDRPPGTDLSTNRVDKRVRDRIARAAIDGFLEALATGMLDLELEDPRHAAHEPAATPPFPTSATG